MKKFLVIVGIVLAIAAMLFVTPILGKAPKDDSDYYGTAVASEGGGEF